MKIIECPRDAMQGIQEFIPTSRKINYINSLLDIGFDTIDFGSFVSHRMIPQLKDTSKVLSGINLDHTSTKLLAIVANKRGLSEACKFDQIDYLGFPLSVSDTFQKRNTNKNIDQSLLLVDEMQSLSIKHKKRLVIYLSMAFGNPYQEYWHPDIVSEVCQRLNQIEIEIIALSDTIGVSSPENIKPLFETLIPEYSNIEFGAHFHTTSEKSKEKIDSAYKSGCSRFDTSIGGVGGCPMAQDLLIGNMATEHVISYFGYKKLDLDQGAFDIAVKNSLKVF